MLKINKENIDEKLSSRYKEKIPLKDRKNIVYIPGSPEKIQKAKAKAQRVQQAIQHLAGRDKGGDQK